MTKYKILITDGMIDNRDETETIIGLGSIVLSLDPAYLFKNMIENCCKDSNVRTSLKNQVDEILGQIDVANQEA